MTRIILRREVAPATISTWLLRRLRLGEATCVNRTVAFGVLPKEAKSGILTQQPNRNGIAEPQQYG